MYQPMKHLILAIAVASLLGCVNGGNGNGHRRDHGVSSKASNASRLKRCQRACQKQGKALEKFCRALREPRLRAGCWGLLVVDKIACKNWCYWHFGD